MKSKNQLLKVLATLVVFVAGATGVMAQPYTNSGDHVVCQNSTEPYGVDNTNGSTYTWTIIPLTGGEGTVNSGQGTNLISVSWTNTGTCRLELEETNGNNCRILVSITVTVNPVPTADAGTDQAVCSSETVNLAGTIGGGATSGTWSGGTGTFSRADDLNAVYTPGAADLAAGTVTLILTTNDPAGPCTEAADQLTITFNSIPTADAGTDQAVCSSETIILAGTIGGGATSGTWSGGTGTFSQATDLNAVYTPGAADLTSGTVTLTLTTNDPAGPCTEATDQLTITFNSIPTADAGTDQAVCSSETITLAGTIGGGATSGTWSGGTGTFSRVDDLNAVYTPGTADLTAGTVTLILTTNDPVGSCTEAADQLTIAFNPVPTPLVSGTVTVCGGDTELYNTTDSGNSFIWTVTGGTINTGQNTGEITVIWGATGAGTVTVEESISATGCTTLNNKTVVINDLPTTLTIWHN